MHQQDIVDGRLRKIKTVGKVVFANVWTLHYKAIEGKNALNLEFPSHFNIYPVVHVVLTVQFREQPPLVAQDITPRLDAVPMTTAEEYTVDKMLAHRKRGRGYQ